MRVAIAAGPAWGCSRSARQLQACCLSTPASRWPLAAARCRGGEDRRRLYTGVASDASEVGLTEQSRPPDKRQGEGAAGFEDAQLLAVDVPGEGQEGADHRRA